MKRFFRIVLVIFIITVIPAFLLATPTSAPLGLQRSPEGGLLLRGEPYRGIGVNYFDAFYRSLDGKDDSWRDGFRYLKQRHIPFIRFMCGAYWPNQWKLYREDKNAYFARMDAFVRAAEEEGIGLIPSLFWQINTIPDIVFEPVNKWGDRGSDTIGFMRTYTREVVGRYKDSPAIWAWEFGNEMNLEVDRSHYRPQVSVENGTPFMRTGADRISTKDMTVALTEFGKTVREIDAHRLIISGHANPLSNAWHMMAESSQKRDTLAQHKEIIARHNPDPLDSISVHIYPDHATAYAFVRETSTSLQTVIQIAQDTAKETGKPLFVGEFGASSTSGSVVERENFEQLLDGIKAANVPLSALWVFDYPPQDKDWNIAPGGPREYQIKAIEAVNREWDKP